MSKSIVPIIPILYQDESLLAVDKPAGVLVAPDRKGSGGLLRTLHQQLEMTEEQDLRLSIGSIAGRAV